MLLVAGYATATATAGVPGASFLPEDRGWEQMSPSDKNGMDIISIDSYTQAGADGRSVVYASFGGFAGARALQGPASYRATRNGDGWSTKPILPAQISAESGSTVMARLGLSQDLRYTVIKAGEPALTPDATPGTNLYLRDNVLETYTLLTPIGAPQRAGVTPGYNGAFAGSSTDFSRIVFESSMRLTANAPIDLPYGDFEAPTNLYEWAEGELRLVGILPNGQPAPGAFAGRSRAAGRVAGATGFNYTARTVSRDGLRIIWSDASNQEIYMRVGGANTIHVSASQRTVPVAPALPVFQDATPDAETVLFSSEARLTDDATASGSAPDLYMFRTATGELTDISVDPAGLGAGFVGLLGLSDDGAVVYFAADAALTAEAVEHAGVAGPKVYKWSGNQLEYITTLEANPNESGLNWVGDNVGAPKLSRVSSDGRFLLFGSTLPMEPEASDVPEPLQLYQYDANEDVASCISCADEARSTSAAFVGQLGNFSFSGAPMLINALLPDGRAIFNTRHGLVDTDGNNRIDPYIWLPDQRAVRLLSSGNSTDNSYFVDASRDGSDVFFATRERLVDTDTDNNVDLYDARVGGGFEPADGPPLECNGDACQGAPSQAPSAADPGSAIVSGGGNAAPVPEPTFSVLRLTTKQRRRAASTGRLNVTVKVSRGGLVVGTIVGRLSQARWSIVASRSVRVRHKGSVKLPLRFSDRARLRLENRRRLVSELRVDFGPADRAKRIGVTFNAKRSNGSARESALSSSPKKDA